MATDTTTDATGTAGAEPVHSRGEHEAHPSDALYIRVFLVLLVVTAVEVALYYWSIPGVNANNAVLGVLSVAKFIAVIMYFMHLRFDSRLLRRLFVSGLTLAIVVYIAYLLTLGVFIGD